MKISKIPIYLNVNKENSTFELNRVLNHLLKDFEIENKREKLKVIVNKGTGFNFDLESKSIKTSIPLELRILKSTLIKDFDLTAALNIHLKGDFNVGPKFETSFKSTLISYDWIREPVLDFGPVNIPIQTITDLLIGKLEEDFLKKFDDLILSRFNLAKRVEEILVLLKAKAHNDLGINLLMKQVLFSASEIEHAVTQFQILGNLSARLKLTDNFDQSWQDEPAKFSWIPYETEKEGDVNVSLNLSREYLQRLIDTYLVIPSIKVKSKELVLSKFEIVNIIENQMTINAKLDGDIEGVALLKVNTKVSDLNLNIEILDLKLKANNKALNFLLGLFEKQIIKLISPKLNLSFESLEKALVGMIEKTLKNLLSNLPIRPDYELHHLKLIECSLDSDALNLVVSANSRLEINFFDDLESFK